MDAKLNNRIEELVREEVAIVQYNPTWPKMFEDEAAFLRWKLPQNLVKRIEHLYLTNQSVLISNYGWDGVTIYNFKDYTSWKLSYYGKRGT